MRDSRFALWGSAGHAKVLASLIQAQGGSVVALFDNQDVGSALPGIPLHVGESGFQHWVAEQALEDLQQIFGLAAIGGHRGADRLAIHALFRGAGLRIAPVIHPSASVCPTAALGDGTQVLAMALVATGAILGEACIVNHRAGVDHESVLGHGVHVAPAATICGCVTIGDHVMIGAGAVILPRLKIGRGAAIGAGAVVTRDVPDGALVMGNPARVRI